MTRGKAPTRQWHPTGHCEPRVSGVKCILRWRRCRGATEVEIRKIGWSPKAEGGKTLLVVPRWGVPLIVPLWRGRRGRKLTKRYRWKKFHPLNPPPAGDKRKGIASSFHSSRWQGKKASPGDDTPPVIANPAKAGWSNLEGLADGIFVAFIYSSNNLAILRIWRFIREIILTP